MVVKTPPLDPTTAVDLGENTPRGTGFSLDGDTESQGPKHEREHDEAEHKKSQDRYNGDCDEEPSFGVAL
jgi:hypothetical protein